MGVMDKSSFGPKIKKGIRSFIKSGSIRLLDQLLPPRCLSCGAAVQDAGRLCPECWRRLEFLQGPACACCGYPFEFTPSHSNLEFGREGTLCGACQAKLPPFDRARAALRYDDGCRHLIISYKHGDRTDYADFFAQLLLQASGSLPGLPDARVVPVPLYKKRLRHRRYNQADLMGRIFARKKGLEYIPDLLIRKKHTPPQQGNYRRRARNVAGVFELKPVYRTAIRGGRIILIDDVYTTGATVRACARVLKQAGAEGVDIVTLARVCQPSGL